MRELQNVEPESNHWDNYTQYVYREWINGVGGERERGEGIEVKKEKKNKNDMSEFNEIKGKS